MLADLAELSGKSVQRLITQPSVLHTEGIDMILVQVLAMTQLRSKDTQRRKAGRYKRREAPAPGYQLPAKPVHRTGFAIAYIV